MRRPIFRQLSSRLLVILLSLTALPVLVIGGLAYANARAIIERRVVDQLTSVADLKQEQITTWLDIHASDARLLADNFLNEEHFTEILDPATDPARRDAFASFLIDNLHSLQRARPGYVEIMFVDTRGRAVLSTDADRIGLDLSAYRAVVQTLASPAGQHVEDIHLNPESGLIEMAFGHVLHAVDLNTKEVLPEVNGAVIMRVRMDETIYPLIRAWPGMGTTGETLLVRAEGDSVVFLNPLRFDEAAALRLRVPMGSPNALPAQLSASGKEGIIATPDYRGVQILAAYRHIPSLGWGFVAKADFAEAFSPVSDLSRQIAVVTVLVLLTAWITAGLMANTVARPLVQLAGAARAVATGKFDVEIPVQRADELGQVAAAFRVMIGAVREREAALKSHAEELELLNALGRNIAATLEVRDMASRVVSLVANRFGGYLAGLLLYDEANKQLVAYAAVGRAAHLIAPGQRNPLGEGLAGQAALTHRTQVANEVGAHPNFNPDLKTTMRAQTAVSIQRDARLLGVLVVGGDEPHVFQPDDVLLLETLAAQLAPAFENAQLFRDITAAYDHTLEALAAALDARDKETEGHSRRVVAYTMALAEKMNVPEQDLDTLRRGALLHDIGKIGVPDAILLKSGPLTEAEWEIMRFHPEWGDRILSNIPFLAGAAKVVLAHQERWDGGGYPRQLQGTAIPLGARIFAVADTFDAITSDRPYRPARPYATARAEIEAGRGAQFDPRVVEAFLALPEADWMRLRLEAVTAPAATGPLPIWAEPPTQPASVPQLDALNRLIMAVSGSLDLSEVLREAARVTVETLNAAACGLFLYDAETDSLSLAADYSLPPAIKAHFHRFPVTGFHNEQVVREACARVHTSAAEVPAFAAIGLPDSHPDLGAYLCVPLTAKGKVQGIMGVFSQRPGGFDQQDIRLHKAIGEQVGLAIYNARLHESVQQLAITDDLTGAYNRRYLNEFLQKELYRCARYQHCVSLIMVDIDEFKRYNDRHGHPAGDEALRQLVARVRQHVRTVDVVARYGGEEFAVVLPETDEEGALSTAEKIRAAVEQHPFPHGQLTVSVGAAFGAAAEADTPEAFIGMADQALYAAKRGGRNRVRMWERELAASPRQTEVAAPPAS